MALKGRWLVNMTWLATMFTVAAANHVTQATPCMDGDTFPHPSGDCNKYLVCASGSLQDQNCITGLNFDPNSHRCVWPSEYACPTTTTTTTTTTPYTGTVIATSPTTKTCTNGQYYVHPSGDCNRYLSCANGILLEQSCGAGLVFRPDDNSCIWPSDYTCPTTTTTTTTAAPYTGTGSTSPQTVTPTTPGVTSTTTCTHGQNYVHPSGDCNRYLTCANGILAETTCATGLNFNPDENACVWIRDYTCPTTSTTTTTTAPYTGTDSTIPRTVTPTTPGVTSTTTCTPGQDYVHPSGDCSRYLYCINGILLDLSCGEGLNFSPNASTCVWPHQYACPTTTTTTTTTASYSGTGSTTPRTVTPTTPGVTPTTTCTHGQDYVHPSGDCTRYLSCSKGILLETSCPVGLNFSPIDGNCVWPSQYTCPATTTTTITMAPYTGTGTPSTPAVTSTTTCTHGQNYVHPSGNCNRYLTCSDGILLETSCAAGLNFSPDESDCVLPSRYACPTTTSSTTTAISYTETGTTTTTTTAPYTGTGTTATTTTTTTARYTGTGSTTPRTVTPTTPGVTSTTTCTRDGQNYVHPYGDCNRYLTCSNGMILEKSCTTGLNFNPYENICVSPSQYACLTVTTPIISAGALFQHSLGWFTSLLFCLLHLTI